MLQHPPATRPLPTRGTLFCLYLDLDAVFPQYLPGNANICYLCNEKLSALPPDPLMRGSVVAPHWVHSLRPLSSPSVCCFTPNLGCLDKSLNTDVTLTHRMLYKMFLLGRTFVSRISCTIKSKRKLKLLKNV